MQIDSSFGVPVIQPAPYKVYIGSRPPQIANTYEEVWEIIGNSTFGSTHMVYDANGQIVEEFVPF